MPDGEALSHPGGGPDPERQTKGVRTLMGDPRKAVLRLAWPMILAMSAQTIYNLVDAVWVAGLGADALSAVGFSFPFFFLAMAMATGLGVGGASAISRRIGARDKAGADSTANHTMVLMVIFAVSFTIPMVAFAEYIFRGIGAGDVLDPTLSYGRIIFAGSFMMFFVHVGTAILRAEGDVNRAMWAMMLGAGLNIVLDPIFIFTLGLGVAGAALATVLSMGVSTVLLSYWLFVEKKTHVSFSFSDFRWRGEIVRDIMSVGVPAMVMQMSMSIMMIIVNGIIVGIGGTDGIAVYSTGWRVTSLAILPLLGLATATVSVCGAAFGARDIQKLRTGFFFSIRVGLVMEIVAAVVTAVLAPQITWIFTRSPEAAHLGPDLRMFLLVMAVFYPCVVFGMLSSAMFQSVGKGWNALSVTMLRTVILTPPLVILFGISLGWGMTGVWWGIVAANTLANAIAFSWAMLHIKGLGPSFERERKKMACGRSRDDEAGAALQNDEAGAATKAVTRKARRDRPTPDPSDR